jgi:hypothetical protein
MLLLDSDAARKLIQYLLLEEISNVYGIPFTSYVVLPQLKYQLKFNDAAKSQTILGSAASYSLLAKLISEASEAVVIDSDAANLVMGLNRVNLDIGEQVLLAVLASQENSKMLTGDKKAIVSISKISFPAAIPSLWPRIICLEESALLIVRDGDFANLSSKIRLRQDVDISLKIIFGVSAASSRDNVVAGLKSYINELSIESARSYPANRLQM